ncbi:hypothetical protein A2U01_0078973, partial [Trifolium medium]|nr:hypothetical protein [Trifolium medium]
EEEEGWRRKDTTWRLAAGPSSSLNHVR